MPDWNNRSPWISLLISATIVWAFNHVLDLTTSGSIKLWSKLLAIVSLGSSAVRDAPYASAAMDAYPIPSLILLGFIAAGSFLAGIGSLSRIIDIVLRLNSQQDARPSLLRRAQYLLRKPMVELAFSALTLIACIFIFIQYMKVNEAILARRIYETDRDIVAPYLSPTESAEIQANFAGIETKAQYKAVINHLSLIAKEHQVKIHEMDW